MRFAALLLIALGSCIPRCAGAPLLSVSHLGLNGAGNREWLVSVAPDASLFTTTPGGFGGRVSAEVGLEITGQLLSVVKNAAVWTLDSPGNNPFTGTTTLGVSADQNAGTAFAALTSVLLINANAVPMLVVETAGPGATTLAWGGQTLLGGTAFQYTGARLAQGGVNFDGLQGVLAVPAVSADFDADGDVDGADFLRWQRGMGDADSDGLSDGVDLGVWRAQFGAGTPVTRGVAEPSAGALASLAIASALASAVWRKRLACRSSL